jgi:hypothetical protein
MNELKIGRAPGNHLIINDSKVSSRHCVIRKAGIDNSNNGQNNERTFLIEDLASSNGTFVNGRRIMQSEITAGDELHLATFTISLPVVLSLFDSETCESNVPYEKFLKQNQVSAEFIGLRVIYNAYIREKLRIMKEGNLRSTGLRAGLSLIPVVGSALGILSSTVTGNPNEQLLELEEKFKKLYICPECFKFLGAEPFENLEKRGYCLTCRTKWK